MKDRLLDETVWCSAYSLCDVKDIVHTANPSFSAMDIVPARLLRQVIESICHALLDLTNSSLNTGSVPGMAVVQPL